MAAVEATCKPVDADGVTLYDCQGQADALAADFLKGVRPP